MSEAEKKAIFTMDFVNNYFACKFASLPINCQNNSDEFKKYTDEMSVVVRTARQTYDKLFGK